jgi:hypothetical protein
MRALLDLGIILGYGAAGAGLMYPMVEGWRFLLRQGGLQTDPVGRGGYVVIGALIALQMAVGKLLR